MSWPETGSYKMVSLTCLVFVQIGTGRGNKGGWATCHSSFDRLALVRSLDNDRAPRE